jgi:hypothetical protein
MLNATIYIPNVLRLWIPIKAFDDGMANIRMLNPCHLARTILPSIGECDFQSSKCPQALDADKSIRLESALYKR